MKNRKHQSRGSLDRFLLSEEEAEADSRDLLLIIIAMLASGTAAYMVLSMLRV